MRTVFKIFELSELQTQIAALGEPHWKRQLQGMLHNLGSDAVFYNRLVSVLESPALFTSTYTDLNGEIEKIAPELGLRVSSVEMVRAFEGDHCIVDFEWTVGTTSHVKMRVAFAISNREKWAEPMSIEQMEVTNSIDPYEYTRRKYR
jgi:hypothetical protein